MKKFRLFLMVISMITIQKTIATTYYSCASGDWGANSTWSTVGYASSVNSSSYPQAGDIVYIGNSKTVNTSYGVDVSCATLNIESSGTLNLYFGITVSATTNIGGTLNFINQNGTRIFTGLVTVNSGGNWKNTGNSSVTFRGGITNNGSFTDGGSVWSYVFDTNNQSLNGTFNFTNSGISVNCTLTNKGTLTISGCNFSGSGTLVNTASGTLNTTSGITLSNLSNQGTINASSNNFTPTNLTNSGIVNLTGTSYTSCLSINNSGIINYNSSQNFGAGSAANFNNTGTVNIYSAGYTTGITNAGSSSVINIYALTYNINSLVATAAGNTVNYCGSGDQTVMATTYSNLGLTGSGTKSFNSAATINQRLKIITGVKANLGTGLTHVAGSLFFNGNKQVKGSWGSSLSSATNKNDTYFTSATGIINVTTGPNFWKGSSSNTNWSTASNWTDGSVPILGDDIEFATTSNYTAAAISDLTCDGDYTINNLTNASSKNLVIPAGKSLKVNGTITIPSGNNRIYIQSSSTAANGTLIFFNQASNPVNGTVEVYSKASWDLSAAANNKYKWQFFGIPVASVVASPTFDGSYVRQMDESGTSTSNHWIQMNNSSVLTSFTGYEICQSQPTTYAVSGQLVNSNLVTGSISYTTGALYSGQHLYGNPYTAAIDITKISFGTGVDSTVYLYNTGTFTSWGMYSSTGASPGQYTAVPQLTAGTGGLPAQIPSTQGFLIKTKTSDVSNATMTINYNTAVVKNTELKRAPSASRISSRLPYLKVFVEGSDSTNDVMWMIHQESCTPHYDNGWDGYKMYGNDYSPQIFANENDDYYQVNSVSNFDQTYIGFKAGTDSVYTLRITKDGIDDIYTSLQLIDLKENKPTLIDNDTIEYKFKATPGELTDKRFIIAGELKKTPIITGIKVYSSGNTLFINNNTSENGNMQLYDLTGRKLLSKKFSSGIMTAPTNLPEGIYIVKASAGNVSKSYRIFLKNE